MFILNVILQVKANISKQKLGVFFYDILKQRVLKTHHQTSPQQTL